MEVIVYGIVTIIWWMLSCTIFLPVLLLLYLNKTIRDKYFSIFFTKIIGPIFAPKLVGNRQKAFDILKQQLTEDKKSGPLEILEIGIGPGSNLEYYPENANLTALDMNPSFEKYFLETQKKYPNINYKGVIINMAENMTDIADSTFDVVIGTYTLCSVKSVELVLKEVLRVLKPGGKYLFLEHIVYSKYNPRYYVQLMATPLWKIYFDGCCLNRDTAGAIKAAGFRMVHCERIFPSVVPLFFRPIIFGIASK